MDFNAFQVDKFKNMANVIPKMILTHKSCHKSIECQTHKQENLYFYSCLARSFQSLVSQNPILLYLTLILFEKYNFKFWSFLPKVCYYFYSKIIFILHPRLLCRKTSRRFTVQITCYKVREVKFELLLAAF